MTKHKFFSDIAATRADNLSIDRLKDTIFQDLHFKRITQNEAIHILREAGACEPEIAEIVG